MNWAIPEFRKLSGVQVRTVRDGIETIEKTESKGEPEMPTGVYERKPRQPRQEGASDAPVSTVAKRKGRPPKGANGSYATVLAALRAEKERLQDKIVALGTAIEALEAVEA